jgi:chaperonin GroES
MILKPVHDRIIVRKDDPETVTTGGIVIPDNATEKVTKGTILAVGPGKYAEKTGVFFPTTLKVGERILFHPFAGSEMKIGNDSLYNMPEGDVWAIIEDDEPTV